MFDKTSLSCFEKHKNLENTSVVININIIENIIQDQCENQNNVT